MIFQKKEEIINPFSLEQCTSCKKMSKRKFKEGDYVFQTSTCSCGGESMIIKIFGESL